MGRARNNAILARFTAAGVATFGGISSNRSATTATAAAHCRSRRRWPDCRAIHARSAAHWSTFARCASPSATTTNAAVSLLTNLTHVLASLALARPVNLPQQLALERGGGAHSAVAPFAHCWLRCCQSICRSKRNCWRRRQPVSWRLLLVRKSRSRIGVRCASCATCSGAIAPAAHVGVSKPRGSGRRCKTPKLWRLVPLSAAAGRPRGTCSCGGGKP